MIQVPKADPKKSHTYTIRVMSDSYIGVEASTSFTLTIANKSDVSDEVSAVLDPVIAPVSDEELDEMSDSESEITDENSGNDDDAGTEDASSSPAARRKAKRLERAK